MDSKIQTDEYLEDDLRVFVVPVDIFDVPDLTCHEQMVYIVLRSHCSARNRTAFPSYATIAKEGRMSRDKAIQAVKALVEKGLLSKRDQFTANKHRKIVQTSNIYTIHAPKSAISTKKNEGSRSQRLGQSTSTTRVVVHNDQGSRSQRPKQNHLTDPSEQDHLNNNKDTVAVLQDKIESLLGTSITSLTKLLPKWREQYGDTRLIELARYLGSKRDKWDNIIGTYRTAVTEVWSIEQAIATSERDERYSTFWELFPKE